MADIDTIAKRVALHGAALATLGTDPAWDKALRAYLRADALQQADLEFGETAKGQERRKLECIMLADRYGPEWRKHPGAEAERRRIFEEGEESDKRWTERFCKPYWRASRELALTPAPTIAAAMFKATMIESDEVWNDCDFPADCMEILQSDFARLEV
ncbi:hypothetical protein [Croceicoccus bisphenolivorans]|uniref:hypothetical protein n=1 Tax=Croceicoccus bisphenolivorans TaxID=1783232 RepID=UPI000836BBD0|nr:hypothetical protein [Croceicoccus bisphenolivorans]